MSVLTSLIGVNTRSVISLYYSMLVGNRLLSCIIILMNLNGIIQQITKFSDSFIGGSQVAVDLGTATTRIAVAEKGVVLREPTVTGQNNKTT